MELRRYLAFLARRKWVILVVTVVTVAVVGVGSWKAPPVYAASTLLRIPTISAGSENWIEYDTAYSDRLLNTYVRIATSQPVMEELVERLGVDSLPNISVEAQPLTELLQITAQSAHPLLARDTANTLAEILIARKEQAALDGGPEALTGPFTVIEPAVTPTVPLGPPLALNLALGFAIGLAGGTGLALLLEALDGTVYSTEVLGRVLDLPVLAVIPHARRVREAVFESHTPQAESFRRLSFHLSQNGTQSNSQSLLVTSAEPQEGKSTVVANLAMALAARGRNVVVVDADVRRPRQHQLLGVTNGTGLSDVLVGKSELGEVVRDTGTPHLRVLTAGTELGQAATRLGSQAMAHIVKSLGDSHDFVLVDTPSYLSVADTAALTSVGIEDTLLVVARSRSRQEAVQAAYSQLMETEAKCVGVVLTGGAHPARYEHYRSGKPTGER